MQRDVNKRSENAEGKHCVYHIINKENSGRKQNIFHIINKENAIFQHVKDFIKPKLHIYYTLHRKCLVIRGISTILLSLMNSQITFGNFKYSTKKHLIEK